MEILTNYQNKDEWDKFVAENTSPASFLQAWDWGEFNKQALGYELARWVVREDEEIRIVAQGIKKSLPFNQHYLYCPRGLVWRKDYSDKRALAYGEILKKLQSEVGDKIFLRTCPPYEYKEYVTGFIKRLGFQAPKILTHSQEPESTILLDLTKSEEELLEAMHPKTRYNIRLAEKKEIKIKFPISNFQFPINTFYKLSEETAKRNGIKIYEKNYYEKLIGYFGAGDKNIKLKLYFAEHQGKPLATILAIYFGNTATYLHGASANEGRELMANYLLQWTVIKDAKRDGYQLYDLWGANENNASWAGITRFKKGFGGTEYRFLGTWDYVLRPGWYNMMRVMRGLNQIKKLF
ncbi:peptidoglycan bridge formation glycyltransferase FemA/FemB family protein [Candidatus Kuenenbacteria bacterium]|nr:peptidoglycan bridge formation glycyltransferase FemA/FemB family protein [Candidatus Kuenenbacteria bacterium]